MGKVWIGFGVAITLASMTGCSGKKRDFADYVVLPNTQGVSGDAAVAGPLPGDLGSACSASGECTAGNCFDGVCCLLPRTVPDGIPRGLDDGHHAVRVERHKDDGHRVT